MLKKPKKMVISANIAIPDLALALVVENDYEQVYELIRRIDAEQQDWQFTYGLKDLVDELMNDEAADKVNGG